ncbi:hypothetical protein SAY87_027595 [Trapa incisa]|uniref:LOB domain-containing protein n=1 Tax=Trapa incisa TaxID=236973 RepID=A0AAN7JMN4_9MYRT|nr:hypothetical protein SAY87_027595 [Trapa incisa]
MSMERERLEEVGKKIKREADAASSHPMGTSRHMLSPHGTLMNTITPCAACKLLRRRCAQECPFFPYFSPHEPQKFASVHKVFGASNVSKMLMEVPEIHRADAANSLVYEANLRLQDPVYGSVGAISALQQQVQSLQAELNAVRAEIIKYNYVSDASILPYSCSDAISLPSCHGVDVVAVAAPPPGPRPQPQPQPPSTPQLSLPPATDFGSISSENISYFG